jgi:thiol-disulfide isomerase/thioredoxin
MKIARRVFVQGSTAVLAAASLFPATAGASVETDEPHVHGLNGTKLNLHTQYDLKLRILDGPDWHLADARGSVVFFNFFATWCGPCRYETPELIAFANAHPEVTTIVVDVRETDDTVRAYRKKFAVPMPIGMDEQGGFFHNCGLHAYPTTLIFRPDGRLSCAYVGSGTVAAFEEELRYALETDPESSPSPAS